MTAVSASDLVRRFGEWQERAVEAPVYIEHHGRARLVLASVGYVEGLSERRGGDQDFAFARDALLEAVDSLVVLADARDRVVGMSRQARLHFARPDWRGLPLADLFPEAVRAIVARTADRVRTASLAETIELRTGRHAAGRVLVTAQPFLDGIALVVRDLDAEDRRAAACAVADATRQSIALLDRVAVARLNLRGYIVDCTPALPTITGLSLDAIRSVRAVTLFDLASRATLGEAIERVIVDLEPVSLDATLTVNRGDPVAVRVALSAEALRSSVEAVVATIVVA